MAKLPEVVKRRIVTELACFRTPPEVRTLLKEEYDLVLSTQDIIRFDATKDYCISGEPLKALFNEIRKDYVEKLADIPIASQAFRLRRLQSMALRAEEKGNAALAAQLIEQAAKEVGGLFTNERKLSGQFQHEVMTPDQARARVQAMIDARRKKSPDQATTH